MLLGFRDLTVPGGIVLGLLAAGAVLTPPALDDAFREAGPPETARALLRGQYTESFEGLYGDHLAPRDLSVNLWGAIDYGIFGSGKPGVVVGHDGWLFSSEEYRRPEGSAANLAANLAYIREVFETLRAQDIALILAVVPAKAEIYPDFTHASVPPHRGETYAAFRQGLSDAGVPFVDLTEAIRAEARVGGQVFMARDTHWSPLGANAAAEAVAEALTASVALEGSGFTRQDLAPIRHRGDLTKFTPTGGLRDMLGLGDEEVVPFEAVAAGDDLGGLFGETEIPVTLIGTSYSAQEQWSFEHALRLALQADVLNLAEDGGGPLAPMAKWLGELPATESLPRAVVWEWPVRFADTDYSDALAE